MNTPSFKSNTTQESRYHVEYLDGWRAFAILFVLIGHFCPVPGINMGRLGVELFFVLSGRLMAEILFTRKAPLARFFWRRVSRVWPALLTFLFCAFLYSVIMKGEFNVPHLIGSLTFTQNYVSIYFSRIGTLDHLWSLSVEEWTYIVLATVAVAVRRSERLAIAVLSVLVIFMVVSGFVMTASGIGYYNVYWRTDVRAASIVIGAVSYMLLRYIKAPESVPFILIIVGFVLNFDVIPDPIKYSAGTISLAGGLVLIGSSKTLERLLSLAALKPIALMSFSLYLWQQPFYTQLHKHNIFALLAGVLTVATASYLLIERPAQKWMNRIGP